MSVFSQYTNITMPNKINPEVLTEFQVNNYFDPSVVATAIPFSANFHIAEDHLDQIVNSCNQKAIYDVLFREKLKGERYSRSDAESFYKWACEGWTKRTYFAFIIVNKNKEIIGAIDIKSDNPEGAEIGYWLDGNSPGFMTNTVLGLIGKAKSAGYGSLYALIKPDNAKSSAVLQRAGFSEIGQVLKKGKPFKKLVIEF